MNFWRILCVSDPTEVVGPLVQPQPNASSILSCLYQHNPVEGNCIRSVRLGSSTVAGRNHTTTTITNTHSAVIEYSHSRISHCSMNSQCKWSHTPPLLESNSAQTNKTLGVSTCQIILLVHFPSSSRLAHCMPRKTWNEPKY